MEKILPLAPSTGPEPLLPLTVFKMAARVFQEVLLKCRHWVRTASGPDRLRHTLRPVSGLIGGWGSPTLLNGPGLMSLWGLQQCKGKLQLAHNSANVFPPECGSPQILPP